MGYLKFINLRLQNLPYTQNSEIIEIFEPNDSKLRPTVAGPKCSTRKQCQLIDILSKPFLQ